jgi:hypothetical protein
VCAIVEEYHEGRRTPKFGVERDKYMHGVEPVLALAGETLPTLNGQEAIDG